MSINKVKSHLLPLGKYHLPALESMGLRVVKRVKILGLWFSANRNSTEHYEWNYKGILARMRTICGSWCNRNLSLKGKIVVFNSLLVSMLQYVATNSTLLARVLHELKKLQTHFLWNGGSPKIAYSTLIQSIGDGGLKLADFVTRIQAARIMWVRRVFLDGDSFSFHFLSRLAGAFGVGTLLHGKPPALPPRLKASPFYHEVFTVWHKFHDTSPLSESEVRWEMLWYNKNVTIEGSPFRWDRWWRQGIMRVDDLLHESEGRFLSHTELTAKLGFHVTFLEALQIRHSIPYHWRSLISPVGQTPTTEGLYVSFPGIKPIDIISTSPAVLYSNINKTLSKVIKAQGKWNLAFSDPLPPGKLASPLQAAFPDDKGNKASSFPIQDTAQNPAMP